MRINKIHDWENLSLKVAKELQERLASSVITEGEPQDVQKIAAGDIAFSKNGLAYGVVVILSYPELRQIEAHSVVEKVRFPYIPGFLSFREAPILLGLFERVSNMPDLILIDGQGIAHPRGFGIASHIGLFLDIPTIGVAKSRLCGEYMGLGNEKGDFAPLMHKGKHIGYALRTRRNVKPIFISVGHLINNSNCIKWIMKLVGKFRIPEPIRIAHAMVSRLRDIDSR